MEIEIKDIIQGIAILIIGVIVAWERAKRWYYRRNGKDRRQGDSNGQDLEVANNPHPTNMIPGYAPKCIDHIEAIAKINTQITNIYKELKRLNHR